MSTPEQNELASVLYESVGTLGPKIGKMIEAALPQDEYYRYDIEVGKALSNNASVSTDNLAELWEDFVKACIREGLV